MIDVHSKVRVAPSHRYHGALGEVIEVKDEHDHDRSPRVNRYHVRLERPAAGVVSQIWLGDIDLQEVVR